MQIDAGYRTAQLLLFPYIKGKPSLLQKKGQEIMRVLENVCSDKQWSMIRDPN